MDIDEHIFNWLMDGDPVIQYQTLVEFPPFGSNSSHLPPARARARIPLEGWGARLLSHQREDGTWTDKIYSPKWISTTYSMLLLSRFGMDGIPQLRKGCRVLIDNGFYKDNGINFWPSWGRSETCVTGMVLGILSVFGYYDDRVPKLADYLFSQQMDDGGWNCELHNGAVHGSFHTTINVLEGLRLYEKHYLPANPHPRHDEQIRESRDKALEFLLQHRLYRSHRTGEIVSRSMTLFSFPTRWFYDVLRALDFAQEVDAPRDERFLDAIQLLEKKRTKTGTWKLQGRHAGKTWFEMEKPGQPSRWNTLRSLRVLRWWNS